MAVLLSGVVALFRVGGNAERVNTPWVGAEVAADGSIRVTEVIDYDVGGGRNSAGQPVLVAGVIAVDVGLALWLRAWELHARTPRRTALWLQAEAFRRYLMDPSAAPGDEPLDEEQLDLYTAGAVALDVAHPWDRAIAGSTVPAQRRSTSGPGFFTGYALGLMTASSSSSAPRRPAAAEEAVASAEAETSVEAVEAGAAAPGDPGPVTQAPAPRRCLSLMGVCPPRAPTPQPAAPAAVATRC
ncbi:hypothetical protein [Streptomyces sp. NPDC046759]|uniref:DUF2207 family protein n=1 Tax=Streptomyces sp. NPDC046759 TaxID=3155019 RepID=UPI0033EB80F8